MKVQVKLTSDSDWQEVDVVGFYDPSKHHTIRLDGDAKKIKYYQMKMQDGRVYDKEMGNWVFYKPEDKVVYVDKPPKKELPYENGSVKTLFIADGVMERLDDFISFMKDCHRVLAERGCMSFKVYLAPCQQAFADPEFKNYFTEQTFRYFLKGDRYGLFSGVTPTVRGHELEVTLRK